MESTNFIFSNILSVEMGEMDYGEDEALHFGAAYYPERMDCQTEFPTSLCPPEGGGE